jgi:hypothetical protein
MSVYSDLMPAASSPPRGKRELPPIEKCVRYNVTMPPRIHAYFARRAEDAKRAGEKDASVSGEIRKAAGEAHRLRHDLGSYRNALALLIELMQREKISLADAAAELSIVNAELGMLADVTPYRSPAVSGAPRATARA